MAPPYWETEGHGVPFEWSQYEDMARLMRQIKGKAVLSINDHPAIRDCFAGFQMEEVPIAYTVVGGGKSVDRVELIIYNFNRANQPIGLF